MEDKALLLTNQRRDPHVDKNIRGDWTRLFYLGFHKLFDFYFAFAAEKETVIGV